MIQSKLVLAGLSALALSACSSPMTFQGPMSGAYEVPGKATQGVGTVVATVYPSTKAMTYVVEYKNLSGPATAAHIHGPGAAGANAPVVMPFFDEVMRAIISPSTTTADAIKMVSSAIPDPAKMGDLVSGIFTSFKRCYQINYYPNFRYDGK